MLSANTRRPLLIGHRGAPSLAKENSLASFRRALEEGLDGVELDVHLTKDGIFAVRHDFETPLGPVWQLGFDELIAVEPQTPRLEEVLELVAAFGDRFVNVDLKSIPGMGGLQALALARVLRGRDRVWVSSFDPTALLVLARARAGVPLAFLVAEDESASLVDCLPIAAIHPHYSLVSAERVKSWHSRGLAVVVWTVNAPELAQRLVGMGVDGLIGDHPYVLLGARG